MARRLQSFLEIVGWIKKKEHYAKGRDEEHIEGQENGVQWRLRP